MLVQALGQASSSGVPDAQALFVEPAKPGSDLSQRLNAMLRYAQKSFVHTSFQASAREQIALCATTATSYFARIGWLDSVCTDTAMQQVSYSMV